MARALLPSPGMKLRDALIHASLVAASACHCPDPEVDTTTFASWKQYRAHIDACIASDLACERLCRTVLGLDLSVAIPRCVITATSQVGVTLDIQYLDPIDCSAGRRPTGFVAPRRRAGAGAYLAAIATLEAASVTAFARLSRALAAWNAPARLVVAARRAIADELAHAAAVGRLARDFGAAVEPPEVEPCDEPALEQLAIENAAEGQIGETFGALVAACQARGANDPEVRRVFSRIAADEARHAALAHQLAPWFERRLGLQARDAVARARQAAAARIVTACDFGLAPADRDLLGVPAPDRLRAAARQLFAAVV